MLRIILKLLSVLILIGILSLVGIVAFPRYTLLPLIHHFTPLRLSFASCVIRPTALHMTDVSLNYPSHALTSHTDRVTLSWTHIFSSQPSLSLAIDNAHVYLSMEEALTPVSDEPPEYDPLARALFPFPTGKWQVNASVNNCTLVLQHHTIPHPVHAAFSAALNVHNLTNATASMRLHEIMHSKAPTRIAVTATPQRVTAELLTYVADISVIFAPFLPDDIPAPPSMSFEGTAHIISTPPFSWEDASMRGAFSMSNTYSACALTLTGSIAQADAHVNATLTDIARALPTTPFHTYIPAHAALEMTAALTLKPREYPFVKANSTALLYAADFMALFNGILTPSDVTGTLRLISDNVDDLLFSYYPDTPYYVEEAFIDVLLNGSLSLTGMPVCTHADWHAVCASSYVMLPDATTFENLSLVSTGTLAHSINFSLWDEDDRVHAILTALNAYATGHIERITRDVITLDSLSFSAHTDDAVLYCDYLHARIFDGDIAATASFEQRRVRGRTERRPLIHFHIDATNICAEAICVALDLKRNKVHGRYAGFIESASFGDTVLELDGELRAVGGGILFLPDAENYISLDAAIGQRDISEQVRAFLIETKLQQLKEYHFEDSTVFLSYNRANRTTHIALGFYAVDSLVFPVTFHGTWLDALNLTHLFQ